MSFKHQILERAQNHTGDVIPTQEAREAEVQSRVDSRNDSTLVSTRKKAIGKTNTPIVTSHKG